MRTWMCLLLLLGAVATSVRCQLAEEDIVSPPIDVLPGSDLPAVASFEEDDEAEFRVDDEGTEIADEAVDGVEELTVTVVTEEPEDVEPMQKKKPACHTELKGPSGRFASHNFPEEYENDSNCSWVIKVDEGMRVQITFHLFSLESNPTCGWDSVRVFDTTGTILKHFCGSLLQDRIILTTGNNATVNFTSDSVVQQAGFLASWKAVPLPIKAEKPTEEGKPAKEEEETKVKPGYLLSFPQAFAKSADAAAAEVCLQMFDMDKDGEVVVSVFDGKNLLNGSAVVTEKFQHEGENVDVKCMSVKLPEDFDHKRAIIEVKGEFPEAEYSILSYKSVGVIGAEPLILVQTDKFDYRPKQKVRVRVLATNFELLPSKTETIHQVWVTNPAGDRLAQWSGVELTRGIAQMEMNLPDEPYLGTWTVNVKVEEEDEESEHTLATFQVNENVLPKYEVTVQPPAEILRGSEEVNFTVCASYTHGGKVKGSLNATFHSDFASGTYWRAPRIVRNVTRLVGELESGCTVVTLNNTDIGYLNTYTRTLKLTAVVTEDVTATQQNTTWKSDIEYVPFKVAKAGAATTHVVGGFPYVGDFVVQNHDGSPRSDEPLTVCARLFTSLTELRTLVSSSRWHSFTEDQFLALADRVDLLRFKEICSNYTSDAEGKFSVAIPLNDMPKNVTKLSIKVAATSFPRNDTAQMGQPKAQVDVELSHINATNILAIHEKTSPRFNCFENKVNVFFTAPAESEVIMSYYVTSAGATLQSGRETIQVGSEDVLDSYSGGADVITLTEKNPNATEVERILNKHEIAITRPFEDDGKVASSIKVLVFIKGSDGKILSDTREYDADSCAPQPIIKFSKDEARPGDATKLTFAGESAAFCGYSVVDKSVALVTNPNKITVPRLQKLREDLAKSNVANGGRPAPSRPGCKDTTLLFSAFERMGLYVMSDQLVDLSKCQPVVDVVKRPGFTNINRPPVYNRPEPFNPYPSPVGPIPYNQQEAVEDTVYAEYAEEELSLDSSYDYSSSDQGSNGVAFSAGIPAPQASPPQAFAASQESGSFSANRVASFSGGSGPVRNKVAASSSRPSPSPITKNKIELRNYFPETWLFDLILLDGEGNGELALEAPHTVTTWVADAFCTDTEHGLTVANQTNIKVIQDFFADINMPYSVKRGEILPVNISVFNTVDRALPIRLSIDQSEEFKVDLPSTDVCIDADDNTIKTFRIKAKKLNEVNITVQAKITDEIVVDGCTAEAGEAEGFTDRLRKPIFVKPEGFPVEKVHTVFECRTSEEAASEEVTQVEMQPLVLPGEDNLVEDSARAWVMISGDIMAPAIANLEKMLKVPYGCGEQNMITSAPNVYVLEYLRGVGKKDEEIETKAKKHIASGFQRQQKYRHKDGSYSIWGNDEGKGSTWLTAFVLKVFTQASEFVDLPLENLRQSMDFLRRRQMEDGCFVEHGYSYSIRGDTRTLTATVLTTLLEAKRSKAVFEVPSDVLDRALECVMKEAVADDIKKEEVEEKEEEEEDDVHSPFIKEKHMKLDAYSKSVIAYALSFYDSVQEQDEEEETSVRKAKSLSDDIINELVEISNSSIPGQLFWPGRHNSRSKAVETTAYAVLTLTLKERLPESLKAIKWLATQRNGYGGFVSTQDTIVALHAIAKFSGKVSAEVNDMVVTAKETEMETLEHSFTLNEDNLLLLQRKKLSGVPNTLDITVTGKGCFMVQTLLRYNVKTSPNKKDFDLSAKLSADGTTLKLCAAYTGRKEATEMVVMEFELLSGFVADKASLENLLNDATSEAPVKRYEYDEEKATIAFYFDDMPSEQQCWEIKVERKMRVDKLKPAVVSVYDYYNQEDITETEYISNEIDDTDQ